MATFLYKTKDGSSPERKPRVYFTCHPADFSKHFEKVCADIFKTHGCAVYYTENMAEEIEEKYRESDLGRMNLFVIPVTSELLSAPNRAMDSDLRYAKEKHIPVLPIMMETGIDTLYSREDKFGTLQYLSPCIQDPTAISYEEKLKKYLGSVLISDEIAQRVRKAFDAYVFLSYRKKDRHYANELMKMIHRYPEFRDIAVWYDEFLTPGESFSENIERMMKESKLFTLLVTPSLLEYVDGEPNYVMAHEYPDAKEAGMSILPTEMEETDRKALRDKYEGIPDCVAPGDDGEFKKRLAESLSRIAVSENDGDPEHNFLIGLAYLDGIDVETDRERGIELITSAAESGLIEAMRKLFDMYSEGKHVCADSEKAILWGERAVEYYARTEGEESENSLTVLTNLACVYGSAGETEKACGLLEKVYDCELRNRGEKDTRTLHAMNNLAFAYGKLGEPVKALRMHKRSYELCCEALGEKNSSTLIALNNLAMAYVYTYEYKKALELNKKAYAMRKELLGEGSYDTLISLNNVAYTYSKLEKYDEAMENYKKAYDISFSVYGELSDTTLRALNGIADVYAGKKNFDGEIDVRKKICALIEKLLGADSVENAVYIWNLAFAYEGNGDHKNYIASLEKLYALHCSGHGESHRSTLQTLIFLIVAYRKYGYKKKFLKAKEKYKNAKTT